PTALRVSSGAGAAGDGGIPNRPEGGVRGGRDLLRHVYRGQKENEKDDAALHLALLLAGAGVKLAQGDQPHRPEETGIARRPVAGIERLVILVDEVDLVERFPVYAAAIEIGDAVGSQIRDLDFQCVSARTEEFAEADLE